MAPKNNWRIGRTGAAGALTKVVIDLTIDLQDKSDHLAEDLLRIDIFLLCKHGAPAFKGRCCLDVFVACERTGVGPLLQQLIERGPIFVVLLLFQDPWPGDRSRGTVEF